MADFQFAIGQMVTPRVSLLMAEMGDFPRPFYVIELRKQICPAGEQLYCYLHTGKGMELFAEGELISWDSEERKAATELAAKIVFPTEWLIRYKDRNQKDEPAECPATDPDQTSPENC